MPGHGDHWNALTDVDHYVRDRLRRDCRDGKLVCQAPCRDVRHRTERVEQVACLRWGGNQLANQVLVVSDSAQGERILFSAYPVVLDGLVHRLTIQRVEPWQHGIEGWIHATVTAEQIPFAFFDTMFFMGSDSLRQGQEADFSLAGLAYRLRPISVHSFEISEGPMWQMERQRRLRDGEVAEKAARPVEIYMSGAAIFLPRDGELCDEAQFQGVIEALEVSEHDEQKIYRLEIVVACPGDDAFRLPVFASEHILDGYIPRLGEDVEGVMWVQGQQIGVEPTSSPQTLTENLTIE